MIIENTQELTWFSPSRNTTSSLKRTDLLSRMLVLHFISSGIKWKVFTCMKPLPSTNSTSASANQSITQLPMFFQYFGTNYRSNTGVVPKILTCYESTLCESDWQSTSHISTFYFLWSLIIQIPLSICERQDSWISLWLWKHYSRGYHKYKY